ncbi:MAG: sigma 54-interacting transcriptional regulator, partial [Candidatus Rokubacteria bacterium]|nr:sigma 54-interacting transcriptional regulator [Candidatus Rokubacteria bacterium]
CLHLVASAGKPVADAGEDWARLSGDFRRFPMNVRKVGRVGGSGEPLLVNTDLAGSPEIARPDWLRRERIVSFAGQPLIFRGEILGVLAVFSRAEIQATQFEWLRTFADHAAVAIANARAFEEVARLRQRLELERDYLREEVREALAFGEIVGQSPALQTVLQQIDLVAPTEAAVLITGESGTGKELVASAIHERSQRRDRALVRVNCASVPAELFESEFFGHVKGAFTGALRDRVGRFQLADRGTLFLDEVGEIPIALQGKLLRVLQEGQFERVGDDTTRKVDVRIIAATNRDLKRDVETGRFRQDLYYRLSVFPIELPSLRERPDDIGALAAHFLRLACSRLKRPDIRLTSQDVATLRQYDWPGNVRELQHVIERAVILAQGGRLRLDPALARRHAGPPSATLRRAAIVQSRPAAAVAPEAEMRARERENVLAALDQARWKVYGPGGAAELLGIKPTTLASRIRALGIRRPAGGG